jgi:glycopeptide antibiotics resistance protein
MAGNVLMFIPAGALVVLAWPRRVLPVGLLALLAPVLEAVQGIIGSLRRQASAADILLNWSGIVVGVVIALVLARLTTRRAAAPPAATASIE